MGELEADPLRPVRQVASEHTQARVFLPGTVGSYDTTTALRLRADHAAAVDAVHRTWSTKDLGADLELRTMATDRVTYLRRPDLGRRLSPESRDALRSAAVVGDLQVVVADGLSAGAAERYAPRLVRQMADVAAARGVVVGPLVALHQARVGALNDLGTLVDAPVVVLLIGERPGLATAESLSAYLAWRPVPGDTDAKRNLISNIHDRGVPPESAAVRILSLAQQITAAGMSGVMIKEAALPTSQERPGIT